jgi:hypothetical protein
MGYTHYWKHHESFSEFQWRCLQEYTRAVIAEAERGGIHVCDPMGHGEEPDITDEIISLNGVGNEGCETFWIAREAEGDAFEFCKTRRNPYDVVVTTLLAFANHMMGDAGFSISSDGGPEAFLEPLVPFPDVTKEFDLRVQWTVEHRDTPALASLHKDAYRRGDMHACAKCFDAMQAIAEGGE